MSYFMTEDQRLIQQSIREFCQNPETQKAIAEDNQKREFPRESWRLLGKMGYVGVSIPEEFGGQGRDFQTEMVVTETLAMHGYPALRNLSAHALGLMMLNYWGTEEQKKKYLTPLASGELLCCAAGNDPAGSYNMTEWGLTYIEDGDDYIVNGSKVLVTNAHASDIKIVFAQDESGTKWGKGFIIEKGTPGLETGYQEAAIVPGATDWGNVTLKNVRVPKSNCLVDNGFGSKWAAMGANMAACMYLAINQIAFNMALNYTSQRTNSGRPLTAMQAVAHRLVNIGINNELSRSIIYNAARLWDEERYDEGARLGYMAKVFVGEALAKNVHDATILHGGLGNTPQMRIGVFNAMVPSMEIAEGSPDIMRDFVAQTYGIEPVWKKGRP